MRYHNITKDDMLNGEGLRVVLWVSGCSHACKNCHNPVTWDPEEGLEFDDDALNEIYDELAKPYISGLTLSGGDPLYPGNRDVVGRLIRMIKQKFPDKDIWLYTGYQWGDIKDIEFIKYVDVLVDGEFIEELKDENYHWAGSSNQKVIDVAESLEIGKIVLYELVN